MQRSVFQTSASTSRRSRRWLGTATLAAAALLAACDRPGDATTANSSQRPADAVVNETGRTAGQVGAEVRQETREAGKAVADTAKDVAITAEVNTLLARDNQLSALKIDVDTNNGQVVLQGSAPNDAARARAADLARSVGGVINVENKLTVQGN